MISRECYIVPIRIESVANKNEHWSAKAKRNKNHKFAIRLAMVVNRITFPCKVIMTRIAPRMLDSDDNLPAALKNAKDSIADLLIPGLEPGRADADKRITWQFKQEKGKPKEYGLRIEVEF